jgi:hypothetical protein
MPRERADRVAPPRADVDDERRGTHVIVIDIG